MNDLALQGTVYAFRKAIKNNKRLTWTDCDEARDYVVPNVLSPRDLVSRPDNMDETVLHT